MPIPILGQPMRVATWYPTTIIYCQCKAEFKDQAMLIITGLGGASMCPICGAKATVQGIRPDGQVDVVVQAKDPIGRVQ